MLVVLVAAVVAAIAMGAAAPVASAAPCDPPVTNPVACENTKPGSPKEAWDIVGDGDQGIQGFATDMSVNQGDPVRFKINSVTSAYTIDIYRMGYYGGDGARKVASVTPLSGFSVQPACIGQPSTGLFDCGNWSESASWNVPADAVSGVYIAKLTRLDTGGASHIIFIVRSDAGHSNLLFQTSDTTWQAYNRYGGGSLYVAGGPVGRAYKVSYNRPFSTRACAPEDWFFNSEYPMLRFLERNGYDVSYFTDLDADRLGSEIQEHRAFLSVGHDEYWSGAQRANVEAARAAGVNLAFFSGNEVFWKTRWEPSIDAANTPYRTLVSYKETHQSAKIDPDPSWTGTWADPRFSPPSDGGRPQNALTGQMYGVNDGATSAMQVPAADGKMRFWRNTAVANQAAGSVATLADSSVGYEWDVDMDNGSRPAGTFRLSSTTVTDAPALADYGTSYERRTVEHNLTMYRAPSGALVFGAGTVQWAWGLDDTHDRGDVATDPSMQQATVNLFADMGVQPLTRQAGLVAATQSTDVTKPTSTITSPVAGASFDAGTLITISGTAADTGGGAVGGVEVSLDGGTTWHRANGRNNWSYSFTPAKSQSLTIRSRATDDSGNIENPGAGRSITVVKRCCSIWNDSARPEVPASNDTNAVELGVKFRAASDGRITGLRFYKGDSNMGTHEGHLWTTSGQLLASVTFQGESDTGWQQMNLATPVQITAGQTYIASYHTSGHYAIDKFFFQNGPVVADPLTALQDGTDGGNGVYAYGPSGSFPSNTFGSSNYWVDVVFQQTGDLTPPQVSSTSPIDGANAVIPGSNLRATFNEPMDAATISTSSVLLRGPGGASVPVNVSYSAATRTVTIDPVTELAQNSTYTAVIKGGANGVTDAAGNALAVDKTWSFTTGASLSAGCPCSLWTPSATPAVDSANDSESIELGVKFRPDADGKITALRFYKGAGNSGTHTGHLWTSAGFKLAEATFSGESADGWQEVTLSDAVPVSAGQTYVASYHAPFGSYAVDADYFLNSGLDRGPLYAFQDGESGGNGVYSYGPSGTFPTSSFGSANYWIDVVFEQTNSPDIRPPVVTSVSPDDGTTAVGLMSNARASFNEQVDAATVTGSTFSLTGPGGANVPAAVSYNSATRTATLNPTSPLAPSTTYTATLRGGGTGIKDRAGNPLAADRTWSFITAAEATGDCPCTIWDDSAAPATASTNDPGAVELGLKFRAKVDGQITGVRFYKGSANIGAHTGHLWTAGGSLLATATFADESDTGWQQVIFAQPVSVNAGTTYIASYHTKVGNYAYDPGYFQNSGVDRGPLRALRKGEDGGNGVYGYGPAGTFPNKEFGAANYWVDPIFEYEPGGGADAKPPKVHISPVDGATEAGLSMNIEAEFNEAMDGSTINGSTMELRDPDGNVVSATVSYNPTSRTATLTPRHAMSPTSSYVATVKGGASGVKDSAGNPPAADVTSTFTTAAAPAPPPDDGPGGPVLVITKSSNPFASYYAEILRAEGLNEFTTKDISTVNPTNLDQYQTAILGSMSLTTAQSAMLTSWVNAGGNLIAMRPDDQLQSLLGLLDTGTSLNNAWYKIDTGQSPGQGIVGETMQYHGTADRYAATSGTQTLATLYATSAASTPSPAVTMRNVGTNGGQAVAFTFDLARSIVLTRQGNPAWESHERDGAAPTRSDDLFYGNALGDIQSDWIDLNKVEIPQADELQRFLVNVIGNVNADKSPLPRFWYLPRDLKAAVVMTGDDHANGGTKGRFDAQKAQSPVGCSVVLWQCIRSSSYIFTPTPVTDAEAAAYTADGFEIGLHLNTGCADFTRDSLDRFLTDQLAAFTAKYTSLPPTVSNRTHCVPWSDWASTPKVELQHGIRLDTTYYYWPASWVSNRPGFMTGSGMPMRFADKDGAMIDVYQAATQMTDESGQSYPFTPDTLFDNALGAKGYYGVFTVNAHTDSATSSESDAVIDSATSRGIPVVTARQMLNWVDGRNQSAFRNVAFNNNTLTFSIDVGAGATGLRAMLPTTGGRQATAITRDGTAVSFTRKTIKGVDYAVFDAAAGNYSASYGAVVPPDTQAPTAPSNFTATGSAGQVALTWSASTDNVGVTRYNVHRGTTAGFTPSAANRIAQPTGTSYTDTGLTNGTYFYRVTAQDAAGNVSQPSVERSAVVPDSTRPTVAMTAPAAGASLTGTVAVTADASDNIGVAGVRFQLDGANLGTEDTTAPYTINWDTSTATAGAHSLTAIARDAAGNTATSTAVSVTLTGLVGQWGFNEPSGTAVSDSSGTGNNGTMNAGVTRTTTGRFGAALQFNGTNGLVTVPDSNSLDLTNRMTIEAWVFPTAGGTLWRTAVMKEQAGNLIYALYSRSDNSLASGDILIGQDRMVRGGTALPLNAWSHLATTYDGAQQRLFINGAQVASRAQTGNIKVSAGALRMGGNSVWNNEWLAGQLDEVRIYKRALTAAEITADMNRAVTP
jgi:hypothetical protein